MNLNSIPVITLIASLFMTCKIHAQPFDWTQFVPKSRDFENFVPSFFSELSSEEQEQLEKVAITIAEERRFGKQVLQKAKKKLASQRIRITRKGRDVSYLNKLVTLACNEMKNKQRYAQIGIGVIEFEGEDAYSIPGGDLLFTRGLLNNCESEAALVGVICHELAHLDRGHQLYGLRKAKLANQSNNFYDQLTGTASSFVPFHPEFEKQADRDAVEDMLALKYDPREFAHLLERWERKQNRETPWMEFIPARLRTHPDAGIRVKDVLAEFAQFQGEERKLQIGRENLKHRIPCHERQF